MTPPGLHRLRQLVRDFEALVGETRDEAVLLARGGSYLKALVAEDDWLPDAFAVPHATLYRQYLLHCDTSERFSIVSFVWGPGQSTPIHNHTVWGLVGVLRGAEISQHYDTVDGRFGPVGEARRLESGDVEAISSLSGDIHRVSNAHKGRTSVSIHVYGGNIGAMRRSTFSDEGEQKSFISGYNSNVVPNLWDNAAQKA